MQRLPNVYPADTTAWPDREGTFDVGAADTNAKILMRNLTPLNLRLDFYNGSTDVLSAWEHNVWTLDGDTPTIGWAIDPDSPSVITPPSNVVYLTLFSSHEKVPGTYPVFSVLQTSAGSTAGTGGGSTNQLINTGNPAGQNVVTVNSTAAAGSTVTLSTDGLFQLMVTITAALVNAIKTNETDPIVQLGALTHLVEVLGNFKVDGVLTAPAANVLGAIGVLQHILGSLTVDQVTTFTGNSSIGGTLAVTGNVTHTADTFLVNKKLSTAASGDLADWSGTGLNLKGNPGSHGNFQYYGDGTNLDVQISVFAPVFSGTGGGTFNHNATQFGAAVAPSDFVGNPATAGGSNANGFGSITTTQVAVGSLNAVAWRYNAMLR